MDSEVRSLRSIGRRVRLVIPFERLRKMAPWLSGAFITFLGYLAVAWPSVLWLHHVANRQDVSASASPVAIPWLAPGVAVLCLMRYGIRAWPAVFAGSVVVWGVIQQSYVPLLVAESAGEALSVVLIVWLLKIWGFRPALDRYKDSLLLLAAVALGRMVSTTVDALSVVAAAAYASDGTVIAGLQSAGVVRTGRALIISLELFRFAGRWWLNTVAGCLLVVPLLALQTSRPLPRRGRYRLALATLSCGAALWIVGGFALPPGPLLPLMLLGALLLAVWATVQFGVAVAAAVTLVLALSATVGFGLQLGIFGGLNLDARVDVAWGFIGLLSGIALFLAALLSQREQARRQIAASAERYQRLFVGNPFPMWIEDAVSGRILLANPAALRVYGYDQAEFLSLTGGELRSDVGMHTRDDGSSVTTERHRTALGVNLEVEVTRVRMAVGGAPVRICFVEIQSECNELRLAILAAGDLERFRLGGVLQNKLMPLLASVVLHANELGSSQPLRERSDRRLLEAIKTGVAAAAKICTALTRGASPLENVQGDLVAALHRLPESLPGITPTVQVSVRSAAPLTLSIERRDHIYRLAEEAVRSAAVRCGTKNVHILLDISATGVRMQIEDDSDPSAGPAPGEDLANRSIAARAVAAQGQLRMAHGRIAGTSIRFECEQENQVDGETESRTRAQASPVGPELAERVATSHRAAIPAVAPWLLRTLMLAITYTTIAALSLLFLREVDALNVSYQEVRAIPWLAGGILISGLLIGGDSLWPALFAGYVFVWQGLAHEGWIAVLFGAAAQSLAAVLTVRLLRRFGFRRSFDRLRDFLLLLVAAAIGRALIVPADLVSLRFTALASPLAATYEMRTVLAPSHTFILGFSSAALTAVARWWLNGVAGIVLVVPALLSWSIGVWTNIRSRAPEFLLWSAMLAISVVSMLGVDAPQWQLAILALGLTTVTWAAVRIGAGAASLATLLLSITATVSFGMGHGVLAPTGPAHGIGVFWGFITLLATTAHVLTSLLAESDHADRELQQLDQRYRALFEAVPHPLFACSAVCGRILLANAAAMRRYGYTMAEFSEMTLASLDADIDHPAPPPNWNEASRVTTHHRSKTGELTDVELAFLPVEIDGQPGGLCFAIDVSERNRLRTRLIEDTDRERRSLAREFHDGLGQILAGLQLGTVPLMRSVQHGVPLDRASVKFVSQAAQEALRSCEWVLRGISPLQEVSGDLLEAIRRLATRLPPDARDRLTVSISAESDVMVSLEEREHLYQIAQEAVTNSLKHAHATRISVTVGVTASAIELSIADDGVGFDPAARNGGLGLDSLALRAAALGAQLVIAAHRPCGMTVTCSCPQGLPAWSERSERDIPTSA
jgi:PAS domain S-box-containing protein